MAKDKKPVKKVAAKKAKVKKADRKKGHPNQGRILPSVFGRPTKYSEDMVTKGYEYLATCVDTKKKVNGIMHYEVNIPSYEGLALALGISTTTVKDWRTQHANFSALIDDLLAKQAKALLGNGLSGNYNPTIAKVLLSKHQYREVTEQEQKQQVTTLPPLDYSKLSDSALREISALIEEQQKGK